VESGEEGLVLGVERFQDLRGRKGGREGRREGGRVSVRTVQI
jgi:hypothetical protein